jgi:hypothetical protein
VLFSLFSPLQSLSIIVRLELKPLYYGPEDLQWCCSIYLFLCNSFLIVLLSFPRRVVTGMLGLIMCYD